MGDLVSEIRWRVTKVSLVLISGFHTPPHRRVYAHTCAHTIKNEEPGMVVQAFNPDDKEAETGKSL